MQKQSKIVSPKIVAARDVVKALMQEAGDTIYTLRNATIKGKLDLRHRIINIAVDIQGCDFMDDVDVGYAEFKQSVDFSRCHFHKGFNSGNKDASHAIYRKDIKLNKAIFDGAASFNGIRCEGSAFLHQAQFKSAKHEIDFSKASFAKSFEVDGAVFNGGATFYSLRCELVGVFSGARFQNQQREIDFSSSSFGTDLECTEAVFKGGANFVSLKCGSSTFDKTHFENEKRVINFLNASFDVELACEDAVFQGGAIFNSIKCGSGFFKRSHFENEKKVIDFSYASFAGVFECSEAVFKGGASFGGIKCGSGMFDKTHFENEQNEIDFVNASFDSDLTCVNAVFRGGANFDSIKCRSGTFDKTHFESEKMMIDFLNASFDSELSCVDTVFKGGANFDSIKCGSGFFSNTHFENEDEVVVFIYASFDVLECFDGFFKGGANFSSVKCGRAMFDRTCFDNKKKRIDFSNATFTSVNCEGTVFEGEANLNGITCATTAYFKSAEFRNSFENDAKGERKIDFGYVSCGVNLDLTRVDFKGRVSFESAQISNALVLSSAHFHATAVFSNMSTRRLILEPEVSFAPQSLDLRECTFELVEKPPHWERVLERQDPKVFSRDPYRQLERYHQRIGDEVEAKKVYYRGCCDLRDNFKEADGNIHWSSEQNARDWLLKWLTGYGVKTWRLSIPIFLFVILGTAIFWPDNALQVKATDKEKQAQPAQTATSTNTPAPPQDRPAPEAPLSLRQKLFYRVGYSLDLFIPVVDLQLTDRWQPRPLWREIYSVVHIIVGWLLIPLLVASLSGIVRKQ